MEIHADQLNILLHAIKDIVKSKNCPEWVSARLIEAVKNAKAFNQSSTAQTGIKRYEVVQSDAPFEINEFVCSNVENDICIYKIVEQLDPIGGVNLYNLQIIEGNANNPVGLIIHNIPETLLVHIKNYA